MNKKLLIFGIGDFAQLMQYYFEEYCNYEITAFVVDKEFLICDKINNIDVICYDNVFEQFSPTKYDFFVATGYSQMNQLRFEKTNEIKKLGYFMPNFIHPTAFVDKTAKIGQNCVILENSVIQPKVTIEDGVIIWASSTICHDTKIKECTFIASQVCINGFAEIGAQCFVGANSTIRDKIKIEDFTLIGAGCTILENTDKYSVYKQNKIQKIEANSLNFKI